MANIYRKNALEKISTPDQLDRAIVVSSPMSWLALIGLAIIFAAVIIWAFLFDIPQMVTVSGIVSNSENTWAVCSDTVGKFTGFSVKAGESVKEGQTIANVTLQNGETKAVVSALDGIVSYLFEFEENEEIGVGSEIARITPDDGGTGKIAVCYVSPEQVGSISQSLSDGRSIVLTSVTGTETSKTANAKIIAVGKYAASSTSEQYFVSGSSSSIFGSTVSYPVICKLGSDCDFSAGTVFTAKIRVSGEHPIDKLIG